MIENKGEKLVLPERIELSTSPLPRELLKPNTAEKLDFVFESRQIFHDMFRCFCQVSVSDRNGSPPLRLGICARLRSRRDLGFEVVPRICERVCGFLFAVGFARIGAVAQIDLDASMQVDAVGSPEPEAGIFLSGEEDTAYLLTRHGVRSSIVETLFRPCVPPSESVSFHENGRGTRLPVDESRDMVVR